MNGPVVRLEDGSLVPGVLSLLIADIVLRRP